MAFDLDDEELEATQKVNGIWKRNCINKLKRLVECWYTEIAGEDEAIEYILKENEKLAKENE